ncbi:hypothetical protein M8J76_005742 [Diaphorina citri]|nr:hypothetical protein M8J76_005742 [Diaphorina citri]
MPKLQSKVTQNNMSRLEVPSAYLETEKTEKGTTSKLLVTKATLTDSGNYTCIPSNASPASVYVHVLNGEHPAAMQHGGVSSLVAWGVTVVMATSLTTLRWL